MRNEAIQLLIVFFICLLLNLFIFLFAKNRILRFLAKSRFIYISISIVIGSFIAPIIQGVWVLTLPYDKGYFFGLGFHTICAIIFMLLMFYFVYNFKKRNPNISVKQDNALKSISIGSVLVCILYIITLPLFWIFYGLLCVAYLFFR